MSLDLYLHRLTLDRRAFARLGAGTSRSRDSTYAMHASLAALFAKSDEPSQVPFSTFAVDDDRERLMAWGERETLLPLLAYAPIASEALRVAPEHAAVVRDSVSRAMPIIKNGTQCDFRVRVSPSVRSRRDKTGKPQGRGNGRMLDALTHARIADPDIDRDGAYCNWLRTKVDGATLSEDVRLQDFQSIRMLRKGSTKGFPVPDARLRGTLTVTNEDAFRRQLCRGVGRQRAFGFGMLLLRAV